MDKKLRGDNYMVKKTILKIEKLDEVKHFVKLMVKAGISYRQIIVFGSHAKGTDKPWSDIDLCVVSDIFGKDRYSERLKLMQLKDDNSLDIEPHPYNLNDLKDKWDSLASEIRKYGIPIQV